jgi:diaminohydroxyphosphoribosylaminopyrimidine deaminase/5-amino-6-(5-phosphoribosylamino)uracil reductase
VNNYEKYIAHCIEIARRGEYFVAPNPMVGAVLVGKPNPDSSEVILAEGWHEQYGEGHAEVNCFKSLPPTPPYKEGSK